MELNMEYGEGMHKNPSESPRTLVYRQQIKEIQNC